MKTPSLKKTEALLWKLITAPEGVPKALRSCRTSLLPIRGDGRLSAEERLDIYANMYFFRIRDSLKEDFPAVLALVGEDCFHNLVTDYLLKHLPTHWSLRYAGRHLPSFLKTCFLLRPWPYAADLARLEWELLEAFDAEDAVPLNEGHLKSLRPEAWGELPLKTVPALSLVSFHWPVDRIREALLVNRRPPRRVMKEKTLLVWRRGLKVFYRPVDSGEGRLLKRLLRGTTLGEICGLLSSGQSDKQSVQQAAAYLRTWLKEEILLGQISVDK